MAECRGTFTLRQRHAAFYLTLAEQAEAKLVGSEQVAWLDCLEREHDNLRAVLEWCQASGEIATGMRLAGMLGLFWEVRGYLSEGLKWLATYLQHDHGVPPIIRAKALVNAGMLAFRQANYTHATAFLEEGAALCRKIGDKADLALAKLYQENLAVLLGDFDQARIFNAECLSLYQELGDKRGIGLALGNRAIPALFQGEYALAVILSEQVFSLFEEQGDLRSIAIWEVILGGALLLQGNFKRAVTLIGESLVLQQRVGDKWFTIWSLIMAAGAAAGLKEPMRGARLLGAAASLGEAIGAPVAAAYQAVYQQFVDSIRIQLTETQFESARTEGQKMTLAQVVQYALELHTEGETDDTLAPTVRRL
ncbi:MAG: hypothetical protein KIT87_04310 [Anaerolineae bacterium]|nr:hypothetical protein [Anaerolineae bacterium]